MTNIQKLDRIYVGESESVSLRLKQHRQKRKGISVSAIIIPLTDKSCTRAVETLLISELNRYGFDLESSADIQHQLFGSALKFLTQA